MTEQKILDIFYNQIINEAQNGKVDCYFAMNMAFDVNLENKRITEFAQREKYSDTLIPTLKITNKPLFDSLLIEYVRKALDTYESKDFAFLNDLGSSEDKQIKEQKITYLIKYVICTLLANASYQDFANPVQFLQDRINMLDEKILDTEEEICLGNLESIDAKMYIKEEKSPIRSETPYRIKSRLEFPDGYVLDLPEIYMGKSTKANQVFGIQKSTKSDPEEEKPYLKQIRKGYIAKLNGAQEHFFLAAMLSLALSSDKEIEINPFLIERWNAKSIFIDNMNARKPDFPYEEKKEIQERDQENITERLIRYYKKIEDVSTGLDFELMPMEMDDKLHIRVNDFQSRCVVFNELLEKIKEYKNKKGQNQERTI